MTEKELGAAVLFVLAFFISAAKIAGLHARVAALESTSALASTAPCSQPVFNPLKKLP